jgi:hypothetical protein
MKSSEFITSNRVADLTPAQIKRVFESIIDPNIILEADIPPQAAQQVKQASGSTLQAIMSQPAAAVQNFDAKIDQLEKQASAKFGPQVMQHIRNYRRWAKRNPLTQAAILAAVSVVVSLVAPEGAAGVAITAIAAGFLQTVDELVLGKKASEAVSRGVETGALVGGIGTFLNWAADTELVKSAAHWFGDVVGDVARNTHAVKAVAKVGVNALANRVQSPFTLY